MPRPTQELGNCDSCGSGNLALDAKKTTSCKTCGQHIVSLWLCLDCKEEMSIMNMNPRTEFLKDEDIEVGREHYGFEDRELQELQEQVGSS